MTADSSSLVCQPGSGHYKTLVLDCYMGTVPLLRCLGLAVADLYGVDCIVLGHSCFAAEVDTMDM